MELADRTCIPCSGEVEPLGEARVSELLGELRRGWSLNDQGHLQRSHDFPDFTQALGFADQIGIIADLEGHHPDLHVSWGQCTVEIWTHAIDGLSESDFILAAKIHRAWRFRDNRSHARTPN